MLIPLGFLAASGVSAGSFDLLETQVLTSAASNITFNSLSTYSAYQHFQLRILSRSSRASSGDNLFMRFNGDTGSNYSRHILYGEGGGSAASFGQASQTYADLGTIPGATYTSNAFSAAVVDILDPFETTKYKTVRAFNGVGSLWVALNSAAWLNTNALSSIQVYAPNGNLVQYSRVSLYGIKAA